MVFGIGVDCVCLEIGVGMWMRFYGEREHLEV